MVLVPDVLDRTPPFVDEIRPGSPAAAVGLRADDLIVFVGDQLVQSLKALAEELSQLEPDAEIRLVVLRNQDLIDVELKADPASLPPRPAEAAGLRGADRLKRIDACPGAPRSDDPSPVARRGWLRAPRPAAGPLAELEEQAIAPPWTASPRRSSGSKP